MLRRPLESKQTPASRSANAVRLQGNGRTAFDGARWATPTTTAMAESFFASLECELIDRRSWKSKAEARTALFTWIEGWYNPRWRHSELNYLSPIN